MLISGAKDDIPRTLPSMQHVQGSDRVRGPLLQMQRFHVQSTTDRALFLLGSLLGRSRPRCSTS
jgi:hypothetical protein